MSPYGITIPQWVKYYQSADYTYIHYNHTYRLVYQYTIKKCNVKTRILCDLPYSRLWRECIYFQKANNVLTDSIGYNHWNNLHRSTYQQTFTMATAGVHWEDSLYDISLTFGQNVWYCLIHYLGLTLKSRQYFEIMVILNSTDQRKHINIEI